MDHVALAVEHYEDGEAEALRMAQAAHQGLGARVLGLARMVVDVDEEEMVLRIRALLRRAQIASERKITIGSVTLDYDSLSVTRGSSVQTLPRKEFYLLYKLLSYPGKIFTRIQLMDEIWGIESETDDNTINVHINRLRKKIELNPKKPEYLKVVWGIGYKIEK